MRKLLIVAIVLLLSVSVTQADENDVSTQGLYGIDAYDIAIDQWGPSIGTKTYLAGSYKQWEVQSILGTPTYTTPGKSDLYVMNYSVIYIYYDMWGDAAVMVSLPNSMY